MTRDYWINSLVAIAYSGVKANHTRYWSKSPSPCEPNWWTRIAIARIISYSSKNSRWRKEKLAWTPNVFGLSPSLSLILPCYLLPLCLFNFSLNCLDELVFLVQHGGNNSPSKISPLSPLSSRVSLLLRRGDKLLPSCTSYKFVISAIV